MRNWFWLLLAAPLFANAQGNYPNKPIRMIIPFAPGGASDFVGRIMQPKMQELLGQPIVVENKPGAAGSIGMDFVAKSAPDGYTVYVGLHNTQAILQHLTKLTYDPAKDFQAVTLVARSSNILITHPSVEPKNLKDLVAYAKANPGKLSYASQGNGSSGHIVGLALA